MRVRGTAVRGSAQAALAADPGLLAPGWRVWTIEPATIEFWQGSPDRDHLRLRYGRADGIWRTERLGA